MLKNVVELEDADNMAHARGILGKVSKHAPIHPTSHTYTHTDAHACTHPLARTEM